MAPSRAPFAVRSRVRAPQEGRDAYPITSPEDFRTLSQFLTDHGVVIALICAGFAVTYGVFATRPRGRQRAHLRGLRRDVRRTDHTSTARALARQRRDAAHLGRRARGRAGL